MDSIRSFGLSAFAAINESLSKYQEVNANASAGPKTSDRVEELPSDTTSNAYFRAYAEAQGLDVRAELQRCACGAGLMPEAMEEHRLTCRETVVPCEFHEFGCRAHVARKALGDHNRAYFQLHREMLTQKGGVMLRASPKNSPGPAVASSSSLSSAASAPPAAEGPRQRLPLSRKAGGSSTSVAVAVAASRTGSQNPLPYNPSSDIGRALLGDDAVVLDNNNYPNSSAVGSSGNLTGSTKNAETGTSTELSTQQQAEFVHNVMAVGNATEEFIQQVAIVGRNFADKHIHMQNANQILGHVNSFLTTDRIHPLAKVGITASSMVFLKGFVFFVLRWFLLWFLCASSYRYIDETFPRVPSSMRQEGIVAFNERRTLALFGYAGMVVWLFVTLI